jgi:hypothetical protein
MAPQHRIPWDPSQPCTRALRDALPQLADRRQAEDLLFLERWEIAPRADAATALRVLQLRRANPELAAAIRSELATLRRAGGG